MVVWARTAAAFRGRQQHRAYARDITRPYREHNDKTQLTTETVALGTPRNKHIHVEGEKWLRAPFQFQLQSNPSAPSF